jgi:hypothetical protein
VERPDRLGAVIVVAVSLAALAVYLLTHPSALPPPDRAAEGGPLAATLLRLLAADPGNEDVRRVLAATLGTANVALMYSLFGRIGVARSTAAWLTVAFAFGTVHWWAAAAGNEPGLDHVLAVLLTLLGLILALSGRWALATGLLLGLAATARLPMLLALPLLAALYAARPRRHRDGGSVDRPRLVALAPLAVGVLLPLVYVGFSVGGPYDPQHVPQHLHAALLRSMDLASEAPWFRPSWIATSLLLTTPLYLWLGAARSRAPVVLWSWVAVALILGLSVLTPTVGGPQFGYRLSLDAAPLLFLLLGWVFRDGMSVTARAAVVLGVAVNTYGMVAIGVLDPPFAAW